MRIAMLCAFGALLGGSLPGQEYRGTFSGMVTDPSSGPVPGAKVSLTNEESGVVRSALADVNGDGVADAAYVTGVGGSSRLRVVDGQTGLGPR